MTRHRSGKFKARPLSVAAPLLSSDACEATRCARTLARIGAAKRAAARSAWVVKHCAALRASMHAEQREVF